MSGCLKKCFIISLFLSKAIFPQDIPDNYIPIYYTADNLEILFSQDREPERVKIQGNVKIVFEDIIINCDKAEFIKTGDITAEGNLNVETSQGIIKAEKIIYNINEHKGILNNVIFLSPPFFGKAEKIEKQRDVLYIVNGYITTCELEKPHYKIYSERLKYVKDDYFQAQRMKFILGEKYCLFYFPRYTVDMKTKEPVVVAKPAYTSKAGENIEVTFTQRAGGETAIKERLLIGKEGFGGGINISKAQCYRSEGFLFKGWTEGDIEVALLLEFLKNYSSSYENGAILIDWRFMDNDELFYNFFHSDYIAKSKKYNYLSFTHNSNYGIFNLNFRHSAGDEFLNIEKLPEVRFYTSPFQIRESPVFLENDFRLTNFYKDNRNHFRAMDILTLKSHQEIGVLTFSPYLSLGGIEYSSDTDDKFNFFRETGIKFSTTLKKEDKNSTDYLSPSLIFFHRELDYKKEQLEYFDFLERMDAGNFVNLGLDWFFRNQNTCTGMVSLKNFYNIDNEKFDKCLLQYDIELNPHMYIEGRNEWDIDTERYLFGFNNIIFNSEKYSYSIGNRYDEENNISGIEGRFGYIVNKTWKYNIGIQYDINSDNISRTSLGIWHRIHCWELNIGISGNKNDFSIFIMIYPFM